MKSLVGFRPGSDSSLSNTVGDYPAFAFVGILDSGAIRRVARFAFLIRMEPCTSVNPITDWDTGCLRGFAFVEMTSGGEVDSAITALNGTKVDGRALNVNEAWLNSIAEGTGRLAANAAIGAGAGNRDFTGISFFHAHRIRSPTYSAQARLHDLLIALYSRSQGLAGAPTLGGDRAEAAIYRPRGGNRTVRPIHGRFRRPSNNEACEFSQLTTKKRANTPILAAIVARTISQKTHLTEQHIEAKNRRYSTLGHHQEHSLFLGSASVEHTFEGVALLRAPVGEPLFPLPAKARDGIDGYCEFATR